MRSNLSTLGYEQPTQIIHQGIDNYHARGLVSARIPLIFFRRADLKPANPQIQATPEEPVWLRTFDDTQTGMLLGIPRSARCVQRFDDSLNSAIHITYRISLRSSSMREPRDPLLKVVYLLSPVLNILRHVVKMCLQHRPGKYKAKPRRQSSIYSNDKKKLQVYNMCTVGKIKTTSVHNVP